MAFKKKTKFPSAKSLLVVINIMFLFFFLLYAIILPCPSASDYHERVALFVRCSMRRACHQTKENGIKKSPRGMIKKEKPSFMKGIIGNWTKIATVNMYDEDVSDWSTGVVPVYFDSVSETIRWKDLFPEWINEEEKYSGPSCPEIPTPDLDKRNERADVIVAKLPCRVPEGAWNRDVYRLQVHLVAARVAAEMGRWDRNGRITVVFLSVCMPMVEIFRCDEMVEREGNWWYYRVKKESLGQKIGLPVGSCRLALPFKDKGMINQIHGTSQTEAMTQNPRPREAYAAVLHTSEVYVCGAIILAQSLVRSGTHRDLVLLVDTSISKPKHDALERAGWTLRIIERIRNPRAGKYSYNKYNYSKFRLWQLTDYGKIIFIDSDILVLRNLDFLFNFPQMSAAGNARYIFNSGIMVIEPSNCTFRMLMQRRNEIVSYNGGDQGYLNEVFVWWHRLPTRVNFLKNFWSNSSVEAAVKNRLFGSDPPELYTIHYLGLKPWECYRDYDCNWNVWNQRVYASDQAHTRWWKAHDAMDSGLRGACGLSERRKVALELERKVAREMGFKDQHWKIHVTDPRKFI